MKYIFIISFLIRSLWMNGQLISGEYNSEMKLAYNPTNHVITGFFESYTGYDETTGNAQFSCIFYLYGIYSGAECDIETYYPADRENDLIIGRLRIKDSTEISIKLPEEHGGCWNVAHFADDYVDFKLGEKSDWLEIRYIESDKSYFYTAKNEASKRKAYLIKGDIVYIDVSENDWVHAIYSGKTVTEGWLKKETLND
jgi:hypothetical protein